MYDINDGNWDPNLSGDIFGINHPPDFFNIENIGRLNIIKLFGGIKPIQK